MAGFITLRDRDAWAAIRGFVYQIDLTIERWLNLEPSKALELERGEDIDIVLDAVISKGKTQSRRLEQIKYLNRNISLRTPHALSSLASFYEHLSANPTTELSFAFITNSSPTVEKPSPMPSSRSAIEVWNDIRSNTLPRKDHDWAIKGIRAILSTGLKPKTIGVATWTPFVEFVNGTSHEDLLTFIRLVEWRTRNASLDQLSSHLQECLATRYGLAIEDAANLYYRLFVHIIRLLSLKGLKRLTGEDLQLQASAAVLTKRDGELCDVVRSLIIELERRVDVLEQKHAEHDRRLGQIDAEVSRLAGPGGISASVNYTSARLVLDPPPLVEPLVLRANTIAHYAELIRSLTWCAIRGDIGSGKTQAALLIAEYLRKPTLWIRFRGLNPLEACRRLDEGLEAASQTVLAHNWRNWCRRVCSTIPADALLVLDDLPRVTRGEPLFDRLTELAKQIASTTVKLLSTSPFDFPTQLKTIGNRHILSVEEIPRFSDEEIRELFQLHGAPSEFLRTTRIGLFAGLTERHPTVLTAMAVYLATRNWILSDYEFDALVKREYAIEINEQTATALMNTVPDSSGRDLIYRLNLVGDPFTKKDIQCVSGVVPQIEHPFEKISESIGLWIQRDSSNTYVLSPLIHQLGSDNLLAETAKAIHLSLATAVFKRKEIGPPDIALTINHYLSADEHNQAARTLLWALSTMTSQRVETDPWGLSEYWYRLPLPSEIDLGLRIHLRAMQAVVGAQLKKPTDFVLTNLDELLEEAPDSEANAIAHATIVAGPLFFEAGFSRAIRYLLRVLKLLPNDALADGTPLAYPEGTSTAGLIWATVRMVQSDEDIREWFETLEQFSLQQLEQVFRAPLAADSAMALADRLWLWEARKSSTKRNWRKVLALLKLFAGRAQQLNAELLWACFVRSQLIVLAEYKKDVDAAMIIGNKALETASTNPDTQFLLKMSIGVQLVQAGRLDQGARNLREALAEQTEIYQLYREVSLIGLAVAIGKNNPVEGVALVEEAVEIVRMNPILPESELIKALGEKAISLWLAGDLAGAYLPIKEGAERLLATKERDDDAKSLFSLFGHVSGYLMHLASTGEEIQTTAEDSDYTRPEQGMFLKSYPLLVSAYREESVRFLPLHIAYFARALGHNDDLAQWSERAMDEARVTGNVTALVQIAPLVLDMELTNLRIPEAIDAALHLGQGLTAFNLDEKAGRNPLRKDFDVDQILGPKPGEAWMESEAHAATVGLLPIFFQLANRRLKGNENLDESLNSLQSVCQQVATTAAVPQLWTEGSKLMSDIFRNQLTSKELMTKATSFSQPLTNSLQALAFLGAALESVPEQAVHNQLETMPLVIDCCRSFKSFYRQILIPFYTLFWSKALRENRFRFRSPDLVQQRYDRVLESSEWTIIPDILTTMASGLGVPLGERVNSWLKDKLLSDP